MKSNSALTVLGVAALAVVIEHVARVVFGDPKKSILSQILDTAAPGLAKSIWAAL